MNSEIYKLDTKPPHILGLTLLCAFAAMGAILMTPALPSIAHYFNISMGLAQLTVTSFLLGCIRRSLKITQQYLKIPS